MKFINWEQKGNFKGGQNSLIQSSVINNFSNEAALIH